MTGGTGPCPWPDKIKYPTAASAKRAARVLTHKRDASDLMAYPCGSHYHVGHSIVKLRRRIKTALRARRAP